MKNLINKSKFRTMEPSYVDTVGVEMPKVLFKHKHEGKSLKLFTTHGHIRKRETTDDRILQLKKELGLINAA